MTLPLPDPLVNQQDWEGERSGVQRNFETIAQAFVDLRGLLFVGSGSPETVVTASPPALYLNTAGGAGTTLYVKQSGADTNTGWIGK